LCCLLPPPPPPPRLCSCSRNPVAYAPFGRRSANLPMRTAVRFATLATLTMRLGQRLEVGPVNTTRFEAITSMLGAGGTRRAALRAAGLVGATAAALRFGHRPAGAAPGATGDLSRAEAEALAHGVAGALTSDPDRLDEWVAADVVGHIPLQPDGAEKGLEGLKHYASVIIDAISDAEITVEGLAIDGDKIVAHGELHGTHDGTLAILPATGKQVRVQYVIFTRVEYGKIAEYWYQLDVLGALNQLDLFSIDEVSDDGY
jgi:predicted ester cyclase